MIACAVATVKTATADILVQTQLEKREKVDWKRVGLFTAFGCVYFGGFQYFLYVKCFSWWFDAARLSKMSLRAIFAAGGATRNNWLKQIGFDLFVINHFFFTVYYGFKISITDPELGMGGGSPMQIAQGKRDHRAHSRKGPFHRHRPVGTALGRSDTRSASSLTGLATVCSGVG